jgi:hypothetical protein
MSKRRKSHAAAPRVSPHDGAGLAALRSHVEDLLARGKTRDAVEAARRLYKETRSVEAETLLVDAYAARIRALIATGLSREAHELASLVVERHPGTSARIMPLVRESAVRVDGDLGPLLAALASAGEATRRELEATLRRVLTDPRALADHPALPDGDALRQGARAVSELFLAVTTGPLAEGALARLDGIPRHSPLAPWKLLVRAIDGYYRHDDAAVLANLSAIPPDSGPSRLVPALRCLAGDAHALARPSLAERLLVDTVSGGRARFRAGLAEVVEALRVKDQGRAATAIRDLAEAADSAPPAFRATFAATVLTHWIRRDLDPRPLMAALVRGRRDVETLRQIALAFERAGAWAAALPAWDGYLDAAQQVAAMPREGRQPSRVLLHMAELVPTDIEELLDFAMAEDEAELEGLIRAGAIPECLDRARLLERARQADPHPDVFRALVAHWKARDARRAEAEAEAWWARHPRDLEPLLYLARAAEERGAHRKALDLLGQAEAIDRVHPEVRRSRFRVLLSSAERHLRDGRAHLARHDLDRLAVEPEAAERDRPAYVEALRWAAAHRAGETSSAATIERQLGERLANPVFLDLLLGSVTETLGLKAPPSARPRLAEMALTVPKLQAIEGLARAVDLLLPLDRPLGVPGDLLSRIELNPRGASAAHLHSLCTLGLRANRPSLAYAASGAGLELESALAHRFLLARGRALAQVPFGEEHARARQCLRAARALAARLRDPALLGEASAALRGLAPSIAFMEDEPEEGHPTVEAIHRVIEYERSRQTMPRCEPGPPRRRRRPDRRQRPRPGPAMPDLLSLLERSE